MKMILILLFLSEFLSWYSKFKKGKALKKWLNEEVKLVAWHPRRLWNFCMSEDEKKEIEPIFTE